MPIFYVSEIWYFHMQFRIGKVIKMNAQLTLKLVAKVGKGEMDDGCFTLKFSIEVSQFHSTSYHRIIGLGILKCKGPMFVER
jgi:hypothetical protein